MRTLNLIFGFGLLLAANSAMAADEAEDTKGAEATSAVGEAHAEVKDETQGAAKEAGIKGSEDGGAAKYGPAGCGLGSLIFAPDSGWTQIFAATTNGSSGNQTFGITSGTSNCDTGAGDTDSAKNFVEANRVALAKDISRGKGATLTSLSELAGCSDSKAVGMKLRKNFKRIFPNAQVENEVVGESVVNVLKTDESLSCSNLT
jgi:hypothetical protein